MSQTKEFKAPRPLAQIQQEYQQVTSRAGHTQYQIYTLNRDLQAFNETLRDLNFEAVASQNAEAEAAKKAADAAEKAKTEAPKAQEAKAEEAPKAENAAPAEVPATTTENKEPEKKVRKPRAKKTEAAAAPESSTPSGNA